MHYIMRMCIVNHSIAGGKNMGFLETIAAIIAFFILVPIGLIPLELISWWADQAHKDKHK